MTFFLLEIWKHGAEVLTVTPTETACEYPSMISLLKGKTSFQLTLRWL